MRVLAQRKLETSHSAEEAKSFHFSTVEDLALGFRDAFFGSEIGRSWIRFARRCIETERFLKSFNIDIGSVVVVVEEAHDFEALVAVRVNVLGCHILAGSQVITVSGLTSVQVGSSYLVTRPTSSPRQL